MTLRSMVRRVRAALDRHSLDAGLDAEVREHLEMLAADYERKGLTPSQARLAALPIPA